MVDNRRAGGMNNNGAMGGYPPYGMPSRNPNMPNNPQNRNSSKNISDKQKVEMQQNRRAMIARQERALQNAEYRRKMEAINRSRGGIDRSVYRLAEDVKPKKQRDYFYVMRKGCSFLMFLFLLITVAFFVLSYLKLTFIPDQYISLFIKTEISEGEEATITEKYNALDPVFGFVKNVSSNLLNKEINLGDSPLYDQMLLQSEAGMTDKIAGIALEYFPIALVLYIITALIMMIKAFLGIFGRKIFKKFGLGSILMIIFAGVVALAGLAKVTEPNATLAYASIVDILIGGITGKGGFTGGYGMLALIGLPVVVMLLSMFARKRVPYSIFDN